jgi:hypothetical protein
MFHFTNPRIISDAQSLVVFAGAVARAAEQLASAPKDTPELEPTKAYFNENKQTLKDIIVRLESDLG